MKHKLIFILTIALLSNAYAVGNSESSSYRSSRPNSMNSTSSKDSVYRSNSQSSDSSNTVTLNFENADIQSVIKAISQLSGKNFVIDPRVKGTINIVSDKPVSKADSYKILESALRMQGFATVEADGVIKVLPETDAKTYGMQTFTNAQSIGSKKNPGDQVVTKVYVLQHGSAMQMSNALRPLIAPNNSIAVYPNSNALIITDYSSNMARIGQIIDQLSGNTSGGSAQPVIISFKHAIAADVAQVLQSYMQGGGSSGGGGSGGNSDGPPVTITVQSQTNSLLMYSLSKEKIKELTTIAMNMDKKIGDSNSDLHVVYLRNADANHIAEVLRVVATGQENPDILATAANTKFSNEPSGIFSSGSGSSGGGSSSSSSSYSSGRSSNASSRSGQSSNNNQKDQPKIFIQAEPTTNSLIIQAPEALYHNLRMIIDMLDVRRAEVMIEAMVVDINATNTGTFGIQWLVGGGNNNAGVITATNYAGNGNSLSSLATTAITATSAANGGTVSGGVSIPNEVYVGLVTGTTTIGGATIPNLGALADMIAATSSGNILSRPTLITLDNEEAKILVGQNIGVPNGSFTASAGQAGNLTTTITRQDLGTFLQIKPKITQSGAIQLDIYQEDSQLDPNQSSVSIATNGPSYLRRYMRSMILVDDGQIIALGGMTKDSVSLQQSGIPILSSIPYLGWLFSWQSRTHQKQNQVLFLRPVIIKDAEGYKALTNQRYQYVTSQQNLVQAKGNILLPDIKPVTLDNQVPYDNTIPKQSSNAVDTPLVDARISAYDKQSSANRASSANAGGVVSALPGSENAPVTVTNVNK